MKNNKDDKLFVRLPHELRERVLAVANRRGESESPIVREALRAYVQNLERTETVAAGAEGPASSPAPKLPKAAQKALDLLLTDVNKHHASKTKHAG